MGVVQMWGGLGYGPSQQSVQSRKRLSKITKKDSIEMDVHSKGRGYYDPTAIYGKRGRGKVHGV